LGSFWCALGFPLPGLLDEQNGAPLAAMARVATISPVPARVLLTPEGREEFDALPLTIQARVRDVFTRLEQWPSVSGAKPLRHEWRGHYRIRVGDWRVIFLPVAPDVIVVRIMHRSRVYED
jgi:mRNA-degrading endonuclease RelE of RelBE toxin-antitoxin system